jgi:hypothetical protein
MYCKAVGAAEMDILLTIASGFEWCNSALKSTRIRRIGRNFPRHVRSEPLRKLSAHPVLCSYHNLYLLVNAPNADVTSRFHILSALKLADYRFTTTL